MPAGGPVEFLSVEDLLDIARGVLEVIKMRDIGLIAFSVDEAEALALSVARATPTCPTSQSRSASTCAEEDPQPGSATIASISTHAPFGSAATPIATRAGGPAAKNSPQASLTSANAPARSVR